MLSTFLLSLLPGCGMMEAQTKDGTKVYLFAPGERVIVSVNGEEPASLDSYVALGLGPGTHTIAVEGGHEVTVTLEPFDEMVVPLVPDQCFMSLDVSRSNYEVGTTEAPKITGRMQGSAPFKMPSGHYHKDAALPSAIEYGQRVYLLRSTACYVIDDLEYGTTGKVTRPDGNTDAVAGALALVRRASCPSDGEPPGAWCSALRGWGGVKSSPLPAKPTVFVGQTLPVPTGGDEQALFKDPLSMSYLALNPEGPVGDLSGLKGEGEEQEAALAAASKSAGDRLGGRIGGLRVDGGLGEYLADRAAESEDALTPAGPGWSLQGAELRKVGDTWLSVAPFAEGDGYYVKLHAPAVFAE